VDPEGCLFSFDDEHGDVLPSELLEKTEEVERRCASGACDLFDMDGSQNKKAET
jgi:hypothetical protein